MKNRSALLFILLGSLTSFSAAADELKITASDWPPYISGQLYRGGVAAVLTEEALKRAGYLSSTTILPWPDSLDSVKSGDFDIATSVWRTEEREADLAFSESLMTNYIVFIKRYDNNSNYYDAADLEGLRIGVVDDYAYSDQPYDIAGINIVGAASARANIEKLLAKELDLVLIDSRVAAYEINQLVAAKNVTIIRKPLLTRNLRIAVSRQNADYEQIINDINASIKKMRIDGSYNEILATFRISE